MIAEIKTKTIGVGTTTGVKDASLNISFLITFCHCLRALHASLFIAQGGKLSWKDFHIYTVKRLLILLSNLYGLNCDLNRPFTLGDVAVSICHSLFHQREIDSVFIKIVNIDHLVLLILCPAISKPAKCVVIDVSIVEIFPPRMGECLHGMQ